MLTGWELEVARPGLGSLFCWVTLDKLGNLPEPHEDNSNTNDMDVIYNVLSSAQHGTQTC